MIRTVNGIRRRLGKRKTINFLKRRFQERLSHEFSWNKNMDILWWYTKQEESEIAHDFNFVERCGDLDQWIRG